MGIRETEDYILNNRKIYSGKTWIAHGNNVVMIISGGRAYQNSNSFVVVSTLFQVEASESTNRIVGANNNLPIFISNVTSSLTGSGVPNGNSFKVRIDGGYGFLQGGLSGSPNVYQGRVERYDDVTNAYTVRTAITPRYYLSGYSLNGYGFSVCGITAVTIIGTTERLDDVTNVQSTRISHNIKYIGAGYSLNGYGFNSGGLSGSIVYGTIEKFDDTTNNKSTRTNITARYGLHGSSVNSFGFVVGGIAVVGATVVGTNERFDDAANTTTARITMSPKYAGAAFALNGYSVLTCGSGSTTGITGTTERFDDMTNTVTGRVSQTARAQIAGYSLNGFGFAACGQTTAGTTSIATVTRFDDIANSMTSRADATITRRTLAAYATNEYFINYIAVEKLINET